MSDPQIAPREARQYLGIRAPLAKGGIRAFADQAFPELFAWLGRHEVAPAGPPFLRYHEVDRVGEPLDVEAGVPVDNPPGGGERVRADTLPAGRYLTLVHIGPYTSDSMPDLGDARAALLAWARDNGIVYSRETERGFEFPCALEHFHIGPVDQANFTKWQTEFAYLIL